MNEQDRRKNYRRFEDIGTKLWQLVAEKNVAYGSSFEVSDKFLRLLYPNGLKPEEYTDMLVIIRVFDKMMRIANSKDAFNEDPWRDIAGYGLLGILNDLNRKGEVDERSHSVSSPPVRPKRKHRVDRKGQAGHAKRVQQ